jgi:DNA-binding CsgD family transcriptional regulator
VILEALKEAVANDKQETLAAAKASEFAPKKKKGFGLAAVVLGASLLTGCVNVTHESISDMQDTELCEMYGYLIAKDRIKHAHRIDDEVHKRLDNGSFTLNQRQCHNLAREGARSLKEPMDIFSGSKNTSTYYIK